MKGAELQMNKKKTNYLKQINDVLILILIAFLVSLPIRIYIFESFIVVGKSMENTYFEKDFIIVEKISKRFNSIEKGDILIFKDKDLSLIKRVIAVPGDTIRISEEKVFVNDDLLNEPYLKEENNETSFRKLEITLKEKQYYLMGDNRNNSKDSRFIGPIPKEKIIGRPFIKIYPFNKMELFPGDYEH